MSKLHSFFNKSFKASKCVTLLKLTIPRINLLRNRREVQLKQMRNDLAKLLEAGQEAKASVKLIELLSIQAPSQEKKLNLLKEIAVEHKLDWDPTALETKFFKKHEDLLNGPIQVRSQCESKLPLPEEKHNDKPHTSIGRKESKQFMPLISGPSTSPKLFSNRCGDSTPSLSGTRTEANLDLQDVVAAAETVAASKLTKKNIAHVPDSSFENPFYASVANKSETEKEHLTEENTADDSDCGAVHDMELDHAFPCFHSSSFPSFDTLKEEYGSSSLHNPSVLADKSSHPQPKRLPSVDDYMSFPYPNLFASQNSIQDLIH
ncbi:hypothetical protein Fmac_023754 [Flemingia macrophylla]|uniref:IST1-like protein n=1 Tax=Flemingia macrophylla TaxID=520843 RepID=A0ABD1LMK1_9FABA